MNLAQLHESIGHTIGTTDWVEVDQSRIDAFADCTDDHQFIHVDIVRAASGPTGGTIAHGFLTLSLLGNMIQQVLRDVPSSAQLNYGFDNIRFLSPVRSGRRVRGVFRLADSKEKRPGEFLQTFDVTIEIDGEDRPALVAQWILMIVA